MTESTTKGVPTPRWRPDEVAFLHENYNGSAQKTRWIARKLNRTDSQVWNKASREGLTDRSQKKDIQDIRDRKLRAEARCSYSAEFLRAFMDNRGCVFIVGEPEEPDVRVCGAAIHQRRYCAEHHTRCYKG